MLNFDSIPLTVLVTLSGVLGMGEVLVQHRYIKYGGAARNATAGANTRKLSSHQQLSTDEGLRDVVVRFDPRSEVMLVRV